MLSKSGNETLARSATRRIERHGGAFRYDGKRSSCIEVFLHNLPEMNEQVLAVPRAAINGFLKQGFFGSRAGRSDGSDRPVRRLPSTARRAEQDPTHKQIIPYIAVACPASASSSTAARPSGESRLHNKHSLGPSAGTSTTSTGRSARPANIVLAAMVRELNEEIFLPGFQQPGRDRLHQRRRQRRRPESISAWPSWSKPPRRPSPSMSRT